jgi:hypothetical protein
VNGWHDDALGVWRARVSSRSGRGHAEPLNVGDGPSSRETSLDRCNVERRESLRVPASLGEAHDPLAGAKRRDGEMPLRIRMIPLGRRQVVYESPLGNWWYGIKAFRQNILAVSRNRS